MIGLRLRREAMILLAGVLPFFIVTCSTTPLLHPPPPEIPACAEIRGIFDHSHQVFDQLLRKFVSNGLVDYGGLQAESDLLYSYTAALGTVDRTTVERSSVDRQMAFWINAYNALTIQAIIERYPITSRSLIGIFFPRNSILQIPGIWNRFTFDAGGRKLTLAEIEHIILRKDFDNKDADGNPILAYIRPYLRKVAVADALAQNHDIRLSYLPYDWHLNEQSRTKRSLVKGRG